MVNQPKKFYKVEPWSVSTDKWDPSRQLINESVFSIGNAAMGIRANFEEKYTGDSLQGAYLAGVYYPDKTRVGWWKNGYPEYFAKILNSVRWIGVNVTVEEKLLDWSAVEITRFHRELNLKSGILSKSIEFNIDERRIKVDSEIFCSMEEKELGALSYKVTLLEGEPTKVAVESYLDFDVHNRDANYNEKFWEPKSYGECSNGLYVSSTTKKTAFNVLALMNNDFSVGEEAEHHVREDFVSESVEVQIRVGETVELKKTCALVSSLKFKGDLLEQAESLMEGYLTAGWDHNLKAHIDHWADLWSLHDVEIHGDEEAQQGIRFCIYQFLQSFDGHDPRLNIGPKGFTGEKYGGLTYWDTEAFCLPYVLGHFPKEVGRTLLRYRYQQLDKAIKNATKLGFSQGAALYPMVTINGEECHNEWEITFEEIHRNGAIAFAIWHEAVFTGDDSYMLAEGYEVLVSIARFWQQRVNYSAQKEAYVILGVTGPNEYENNVNNNWYTNFLAQWCMQLASGLFEEWKESGYRFKVAAEPTDKESQTWHSTATHMYLPIHPDNDNIFLQQDGFLDKDIRPASSLDPKEIPLHHHWSWDRILRSCFIKQADVLQGISYFPDQFSHEQIKDNFDFYEPMTVHESSLSPSVYATIASWIGDHERMYTLFLRSCRLDLDDYNADAVDGLHVTSMPGAWNALFFGICGLRWINGQLECITTAWPEKFEKVSFTVIYDDAIWRMIRMKDQLSLTHNAQEEMSIEVNGQSIKCPPETMLTIEIK